MNNFESLPPNESRKLSEKMNDHLIACSCCRRYVDKCEARSIFDFNIKICKRCALNEKALPNFNWLEDIKWKLMNKLNR